MRVMYTLETITLQPFDVVHSVFFLFFFFCWFVCCFFFLTYPITLLALSGATTLKLIIRARYDY